MAKMSPTQQLMRETIVPQAYAAYETTIDGASFFEFYVAQQYLKRYEISDEEVNSGIVGGGGDGGCDGIYLFLNDTFVTAENCEELQKSRSLNLDLYVFQAKNTLGFEEAAILRFKTLSDNLLNLSVDFEKYKGRYSDDLCEHVEAFLTLYRKIVVRNTALKIHFVYVSLGEGVSKNIKAQADELSARCRSNFPVAEVDVDFVTAERLFELSRQNPSPYRILKLSAQPMAARDSKGYVALVRLADFQTFLEEDGKMAPGLLDANVRDYQGLTSVNKAILDTLENDSANEFWWLNNGVTILARGIALMSQVEFKLEDPKIVNGLQTSREIFDYFRKYPERRSKEERSVLVRIISSDEDETRDKVILATNSQTAIPPASLRATDPIHLQIELYCRRKGVFYDRRKNQYRNQGVKICDIVSIGFMGQCLITLLMAQPNSARARPSTVLSDDGAYGKLFNRQYPLEMYYRVARAGRKISEFLWKCDALTRSQRTNIFYYVIFAVCARITGKDKMYAQDLEMLDLNAITESLVEDTIQKVLQLFLQEGGTDKIAKGPQFIGKLIDTLIAQGWVVPLDKQKQILSPNVRNDYTETASGASRTSDQITISAS